MSQLLEIQRHFAAGRTLTQREATKRFGCTRLAARVHELKRARFPVLSRFVEVRDGKQVKEYRFDTRRRASGNRRSA